MTGEPMSEIPHTPIEARDRGVPLWTLAIAAFLFLVGGVYFLSNLAGPGSGEPPVAGPSGAAPSGGADPAVGARLVGEVSPACSACHGAEMQGQGAFPSLLNVEDGPVSENLQDLAAEHPDEWIALWIDGTTPETEGIDRMGMPAFGEQLSREQIDAIVAYLLTLD